MAEHRAKERLNVLTAQLKPAANFENRLPLIQASISSVGAGGPLSLANAHPFKYTCDGPRLTFEQRRFYEENGYLVVRKLVCEDDISAYRARFDDICMGRHMQPNMTVMRDVSMLQSNNKHQQDIINKLQDYYSDPVLSGYFNLPQVLDYVQSFCGPDISAMHTMLINKPPDSGSKTSRHPLHQDLNYFPFRPADKIVCSWTAMQKATRENGCLVVVPGSHVGELQHHSLPKWEGGVNKMYYGIETYSDNMKLLYLDMEAGDTVFFHPILIHGSGRNQTKGYRKAISCHFASSHCYYPEGEKTSQSDLLDEVSKIVKRRFPDIEISYEDTWRFRSVVVRGESGEING